MYNANSYYCIPRKEYYHDPDIIDEFGKTVADYIK